MINLQSNDTDLTLTQQREKTIENIISDYLTGNYTQQELSKKYNKGLSTVKHYLQKIDSQTVIDNRKQAKTHDIKTVFQQKFIEIGLTPDYIANKIKKLVDSEDLKEVRDGVKLYNEYHGIKATGDKTTNNLHMPPILKLPTNDRMISQS